jgi:hypothetical protein
MTIRKRMATLPLLIWRFTSAPAPKSVSLYSRLLDTYGMREFVDREFPNYLTGVFQNVQVPKLNTWMPPM